MKIFIQMKACGKRKPILEKVPYEIADSVHTLRDFLTEIVQTEVARYNEKEPEQPLLRLLTQEEIADKMQAGKVGFGSIYSSKKAKQETAVKNALQCFEDGLVRVFHNGIECEDLEAVLPIAEGDDFTFIRMTFLAGRLW